MLRIMRKTYALIPVCFFLICSCLSACKSTVLTPVKDAKPDVVPTKEVDIPSSKELLGLASPIQMQADTISVLLEDYFQHPGQIEYFSFDEGSYKATLIKDSTVLFIKSIKEKPGLVNLSIRLGGKDFDILVKPSKREAVKLVYVPEKGESPKSVGIAGDLNSWNPASTPMRLEDGDWVVDLKLDPGDYPYKFVVDGEWVMDAQNGEKISNGQGGFNSLLSIDKPPLYSLPFLYLPKQENENEIAIHWVMQATNYIAYWNNQRLDITPIKGEGISVQIPERAKKVERSYIRVFGENDLGLSNDMKIPLSFGKILSDTKEMRRMDTEAMSMYFPLVDRFHNGNPNNDEPLEDERLEPIQNFMGGDIAGITEKIRSGYFKELGINTLWLSPITQNPLEAYREYPEPRRWYSGYHGYWPIKSNKVDHRFGTDEELHELVRVAHENDMNVLLDFICNHVHQNHQMYQNHPEWATKMILEDGTTNIRIWDEQRLTTWFDDFLPSLNLSKPPVIEMQADSAFYWLKEFGLDGYRHDATKHIPLAFWRHLTKKIKKEVILEEGRPVYQVGETYGSHELIASYISSGMVDAQFDFNLHFTARDAFAKDDASFKLITDALRATFDHYGYHSSMANITGNHDQTRFMGLASGAVDYAEDQKEAGFLRDIQVKDEAAYGKLASMTAFLMSIPGVPVIYYGDEIGMVGASDPDNRRMMRFDGWNEKERELKASVEALSNFRRNSLPLIFGDTYMLKDKPDFMAWSRTYNGETVICVFNKSGTAKGKTFQLPDFLDEQKYASVFGHTTIEKTGNYRTITFNNKERQYDFFVVAGQD